MDTTAPEAPQPPLPNVQQLIELMPEAGHVYVTVALERWNNRLAQQQMAQQQQHLVAMQSALLAAGIDPLTLQPKGEPEVGADGDGDPATPKDGAPVPSQDEVQPAKPKDGGRGAHD